MPFAYTADGTGTPEDLLALVEETIARGLKLGKETIMPGGLQMKEFDLEHLQDMRRELINQIAAKTEGSSRTVIRRAGT